MIMAVEDLVCDWGCKDDVGGEYWLSTGAMVKIVAKLSAEGPFMVIVDGEEFNIFPEMASSIYVKKIV